MVNDMFCKFGDDGKKTFLLKCVYVPILLTGIHRWGVVKISQDPFGRKIHAVIVEWGTHY